MISKFTPIVPHYNQATIALLLFHVIVRFVSRLLNFITFSLFVLLFYMIENQYDEVRVRPDAFVALYNLVNQEWYLEIKEIVLTRKVSNLDIIFHDVTLSNRITTNETLAMAVDRLEVRYYAEDIFRAKTLPRYGNASQVIVERKIHHSIVQDFSAHKAYLQDKKIMNIIRKLQNQLYLPKVDSSYTLNQIDYRYSYPQAGRYFRYYQGIFGVGKQLGSMHGNFQGKLDITNEINGIKFVGGVVEWQGDIFYGTAGEEIRPEVKFALQINPPENIEITSRHRDTTKLLSYFNIPLHFTGKLQPVANVKNYQMNFKLEWVGRIVAQMDFDYLGDLWVGRDVTFTGSVVQWDLRTFYSVAKLYLEDPVWTNILVSGGFRSKIVNRKIIQMDFKFYGDAGKIHMLNASTVTIDHWRLEGELITRNQQKLYQLDYYQDQLGAKASGQLQIKQEGSAKMTFQLDYKITDLPFQNLYDYWPSHFASDTRAWAGRNIKTGQIALLQGQLHSKINAMRELELVGITGVGEAQDFAMHPNDGLPLMHDVAGHLSFTENRLDLIIEQGINAGGNIVAGAKVGIVKIVPEIIPAVNLTDNQEAQQQDLVLLEAEFDVDSKLAFLLEIAEQYSPSLVDYQEILSEIEGKASTQVTLKVALSEDPESEHLALKVESQLYDTKFALSWFELVSGKGKLVVTDEDLNFTLNFDHGGEVLSVNWSEGFGDRDQRIITVDGNLSATKMLENLYSPFAQDFAGAMNIDVLYQKPTAKPGKITGKINMQAVDIFLHPLFIEKQAGQEGFIKIQGDVHADGEIFLKEIEANFAGIDMQGQIKFLNNGQVLATLPNISWGERNQMVLDAIVEANDDADILLEITALDLTRLADLSGISWVDNHLSQEEGEVGAVTDIEGVVEKIYLRSQDDHHFLADATFTLNFDGDILKQASFDVPDENQDLINFQYKKDSYDFGAFNLAVNSLGKLTKIAKEDPVIDGAVIKLSSNKLPGKDTYTGRLEMGKAVIYNMPGFSKLLDAIAIFTGNFTIIKRGSSMDGFFADFYYDDKKIIIENMRLYSLAQGITGSGVIDIKNSAVDLEGNAIPLYILTRILGKTPILGPLLIGGEGDGLFAVGYHISGKEDDIKVDIKPLEVILPGFVKKIRDSLVLSADEKALIEIDNK